MAGKGKYRIQAVAEMTGIPAATLRAWERRYGIPSPERTNASYRLYSPDDVELIRRLRELCESGMAPAEAAKVVQQMSTEEVAPPPDADPFAAAVESIVRAVERFDPRELDISLRRVMFLGSATTVYERVLAPAMKVIGQRWHEGTMSIAQEHMATEALGSVARDMLRLIQPEHETRQVLLACFADEEHNLPLYGVAFRTVAWGYRPVVLGVRTPPSAIRHAVESLEPVLVGLSVTVAPPAYRARELLEQYADACRDTAWAVGGGGAESLKDLIEPLGGMVIEGDLAGLKPKFDAFIARQRMRGTGSGK